MRQQSKKVADLKTGVLQKLDSICFIKWNIQMAE